jgi:DNA repair protein RadC
MQNQNRAGEKAKAKSGGLQEKHPTRWTICKEVKVVTVREEPMRSATFDSPELIAKLWRAVIANANWYSADKENLVSFGLDTRYRLKSFCLVSIGSLNETIAHPREIFRTAVVDAAHSIVVAHNHPSDDPSPSKADTALTRRLHDVGELLQIPLLDHIIVTGGNFFSFREGFSHFPPRNRSGPSTVFLRRKGRSSLKYSHSKNLAGLTNGRRIIVSR